MSRVEVAGRVIDTQYVREGFERAHRGTLGTGAAVTAAFDRWLTDRDRQTTAAAFREAARRAPDIREWVDIYGATHEEQIISAEDLLALADRAEQETTSARGGTDVQG